MRPAPKEPAWRISVRKVGDWFLSSKAGPIISYVGTIVATVAAIVEGIKTQPTGWDILYLIVKWGIVGVLAGLVPFFFGQVIGRVLTWISNFRPGFSFEPKIGNWFELNENGELILVMAIGKKVSGVFVDYVDEPLLYGEARFNYMQDHGHGINTVEEATRLPSSTERLSGPLVKEFVFGKRYRGGYGLRIGAFLRSGFLDGMYELRLTRDGQYRNWPIKHRELSVRFTINAGEITILEDNKMDKQSKKMKSQKEKPFKNKDFSMR